MLYLIQTNLWLLFLAAAFASVAGWTWAALRASPREQALVAERERVMRETLAAADSGVPSAAVPAELQSEMDTLRRRADLDAARFTEMQRALESARAQADEATSRSAEAARALDQHRADAAAQAQIVASTPAPSDDERESEAWRLRYFEQRVRYLEARPQAAPVAAEQAPSATPAADPQEMLRLDWRARYAEARARHLEEAVRQASAPLSEAQAAAAPAVAAPGEADDLSRWRMSYLEKRLAHAQTQTAEPAPQNDVAAEADRLKWRTHYLESRVRHLDALLAAQPAPTAALSAPQAPETPAPAPAPAAQTTVREEEVEPTPPPLVPPGAEERPPSLPAARNGAPDDLSLIDGVSPMLRSTLNSLGVYHFEQIAKWTPANVAWVDQYLRLRGRISEEEWVEQADDLAREGPAARRVLEEELA
ncbi:MAG: hypothetical protein ABUS57_02685 [Pseudomonadota bacterium]